MVRKYLSLGHGELDLISGNKQREAGKKGTRQEEIGEGLKEQEVQVVQIFSLISQGKGSLPMSEMKNSFKLEMWGFGSLFMLAAVCGDICSAEEINPPGWH